MTLLGRRWSAGHCADSGTGGRGTRRELRVSLNGRWRNGDVSGCMCLRGSRLRFRFQSSNLVQLRDECCSFVIFAGRSSVSEGASDANDLFDLADIRFAVVDGVLDPSDGGEDGLVGSGVVGDGDGSLGSSKWRANGGTTTWNFWYGGWYVFLIGVIEFTGGLIWVWEVVVCDSVKGRLDERLAYWICGNIWGSRAWRNGEWIHIFFGCEGEFCEGRDIGHMGRDESGW